LRFLHADGFTANDTPTYHSGQTLRVAHRHPQRLDRRIQRAGVLLRERALLGTDTKQPSAIINVASQSDTEVTLAYSLYRPHDTE